MNQPSKSLLVSPIPATRGRLVRPALLASSMHVLESARAVEALAARRPSTHEIVQCMERLSAHREILARRAANVALAHVTTADELCDLRDATRRLIAVRGWAARKLGLASGMN